MGNSTHNNVWVGRVGGKIGDTGATYVYHHTLIKLQKPSSVTTLKLHAYIMYPVNYIIFNGLKV